MLIILFGSPGEMGERSRNYFKNKGYELIEKINYVPEDSILKTRFGRRLIASKETVSACDFKYENNGMIVGFNKEQIIDAVRGRKKCLISTSSETIDFVRQIKAAYGDYVTVIGTYIDEQTLERIFHSYDNISEEEFNYRMQIGRSVKKNLIDNRKLFDSIVIYGGENSMFGNDALAVQYDDIIEKSEKRERELNNKMYVELPYTGNEDYIFVSYSHADTEKVFPVLRMLQLAGCRVWYDEGIRGGENWLQILASKIKSDNCKDFIVFSSYNSVKSKHVQAEVHWAIKYEKKITPVRLDDAEFDDGIEMYLTGDHSLFADSADFRDKLLCSVESTVKMAERKTKA